MWKYLFRRFLYMLLTVWVISIISFALIQLPPGDYVTNLVNQLVATSAGASTISSEYIAQLREMYGFNQPIYVQYFKWIGKILTRGEFGYSFVYKRDAAVMIVERLPMTFALSFSSFILVWVIALPIGIYSAVRQYTIGDYFFSFIGFIGVAVPNFLIALVLQMLSYLY